MRIPGGKWHHRVRRNPNRFLPEPSPAYGMALLEVVGGIGELGGGGRFVNREGL